MKGLVLCCLLLAGCAPARSCTFGESRARAERRVEPSRDSSEPHWFAELIRDVAGLIPGVGIH